MKFLHTSDWHIGRSLYGRKRYEEFSKFLDYLAKLIAKENISTLLISGDIFDTGTPSNKAQELYYRFLCKVASSCCNNVIIIAGNHDSPSFLNAPKELLRVLNVHVIGAITDNFEDEIIVLYDEHNKPKAIVCAVPYLRDKDIRIVEVGESVEDKNTKLICGIKTHYTAISKLAENKQEELQTQYELSHIPIIAMGHLFTAGGKTIDGDGVRELYIGSLSHINKNIFSNSIDYLALGHLHVPQMVGGSEHIRYSGSPIPMGYGEAKQEKSVVILEFLDNSKDKKISLYKIPVFQAIEKVSGEIDTIIEQIENLKSKDISVWLEIEYTGDRTIGNLRELIDNAIIDTAIEVLRIKNKHIFEHFLSKTNKNETLDDLDVNQVFIRCLDANNIPQEERSEIISNYQEIVQEMLEEDKNAE